MERDWSLSGTCHGFQLRSALHNPGCAISRIMEHVRLSTNNAWSPYLRKKGMGTYRRGSNSESGMRLLRRLEKNHDGIRSAATRQHYIQIYQAMKYLSLDIAEFIEHGPQMTGPPRV